MVLGEDLYRECVISYWPLHQTACRWIDGRSRDPLRNRLDISECDCAVVAGVLQLPLEPPHAAHAPSVRYAEKTKLRIAAARVGEAECNAGLNRIGLNTECFKCS